MSFLDEFDRRAKEQNAPPAPEISDDERQLLEFADLVRTNLAATPEERARVLARIRAGKQKDTAPAVENAANTTLSSAPRQRGGAGGGAIPPPTGPGWGARILGAAAIVFIIVMARLSMNGQPPPKQLTESPPVRYDASRILKQRPADGPIAAAPHFDAKSIQDEFSGVNFPEAAAKDDAGAEVANDKTDARLLRVSGLAMLQLKGEKRWRVCARGQAVAPGATLRVSRRSNGGVKVLTPDGSTVTAAPGATFAYESVRAWTLSEGNAYFDMAAPPADADKNVHAVTIKTPTAIARQDGAQFGLEVAPNITVCWADRGHVALNRFPENAKVDEMPSVCDAGTSVVIDKNGVQRPDKVSAHDWLQTLQSLAESDHGIGQLIASAEKSTEHVALEVKSHNVSVTVMDQVARTFVDMVFVNNSDRRLEGTFYYPLPADASISEFAMYVGDKRIVGEVLEQQRARQIFEYIVRQQKDPALLEYAGGNIFKMRVFPIEPRSEKRVQLGYTQILQRSAGKVTYTYPLFSEMLLKNPLQNLSLEFHVRSSYGIDNLTSPTHRCTSALSPDKTLGTAAFRAKNYAPTRDFCVTYDAPNAPECAAFANQRPEDDNSYFMLQLCPAAQATKSEIEPRLLLIVDGSATSDPQEYAIATEFAAAAADVSRNWDFGLVRGGQAPEIFGGAMLQTDASTPDKVREFLSTRPPLGATDLLSTFRAAAKIAGREQLRVVYIGSGIDTVSENAQSQLIGEIAGLFSGKNITLSMVAVGSRYERPIMQGLAAALGGAFTRIEGADGIPDAVGRINDGFYRAALRDVRVEFEGLAVNHVYPEILGTITAGDTAVVLGRVTAPGKGKVTVRADADGQEFAKSYDIDLSANETQNRFLPRLWARAHMEALLAGMGLSDPKEDASIRKAVIDTSCTYQIMSPYTAFLVLESEEDYARFGIKRTMKQWDWNGEANEIAGGKRQESAMTAPAASPAPASKSLANKEEAEGLDASDAPVAEDDAKNLGAPMDELEKSANMNGKRERAKDSEFDGDGKFDMDRRDIADDFEPMHEKAAEERSMKKAYLSDEKVMAQAELGDHFESTGGFVYQQAAQSFSSLVLNGGTLVDIEIDQPLRPLSYYQRLVKSGKADLSAQLNLSLAYEADGQFVEALKALQPVLEQQPALPELWLQNASLSIRCRELEDQAKNVGIMPLFSKAIDLTPEAQRPALKLRIAQLLTSLKQNAEAIKLYRELLDNAGNQPPQNIVVFVSQLAYGLSSAKDEKGCREALEDALKRWPADAAMRLAVAQCFSNALRDNDRAIAIMRGTEKLDDAGRQLLISLLVHSGKIDDAIVESNALVASAKDSNAIYSVLSAFYNTERARASNLALGFLKPGSTPIQAAAALQYFQSYSYGMAWKEEDAAAIVAAASRADLPPQAKINAFYLLANNNLAAQFHIDNPKQAAILEPLLTKTATKEELAQACQALQALSSRIHDEGTLNHTRRLLQEKEFEPWQRAQLKQIEYATLEALGRKDEAAAVMNALFDAADEASVQSAAWNLMSTALNQNNTDSAVRILERYAARFPNSGNIVQLHNNLMQSLRYRQDRTAIDAVKKRLLAAYPATPACISLRVQLLTNNGQWKEGIEAVRTAMDALQKEHDNPAAPKEEKLPSDPPKPQSEDEKKSLERQKRSELRQRERVFEQRRLSLLRMLARLCGRDAESRAAFIADAETRAKSEDAGQREWTEAILTCLDSAGDLPGVIKRLETLSHAEAGDPLWNLRLGSAYLQAHRYREAREILTPIAQSRADDYSLALTLRGICLKLKDDKGAEEWFTRAFNAIAAEPSRLTQFAYQWQQQHPEWACRAWKRYAEAAEESQKGYGLYQAAVLAQQLGRESEAVQLNLDTLLQKGENSYASSAMSQLTGLAQKEEHLRAIEKRLAQAPDDQSNPSRAAIIAILRYKLEKLKNSPRARETLTAAARLEGLNYDAISQVASALIAENLYDEAVNYALNGGGKIPEEQRRQAVRNLTYQFNSDQTRSRQETLLRYLIAKPDNNTPNDVAQLIQCLIASNKLPEAEKELRAQKLTQDAWGIHNAWNTLISTHVNQRHFDQALDLCKDFIALEIGTNQYGEAFNTYTRTCLEAARQRQLSPMHATLFRKLMVEVSAAYFDKPQGSIPWNNYNHTELRNVAGINIGVEVDKLAEVAGANDDPVRVVAAAQYYSNSERPAQAVKLYRRALTLKGVDEQNIYPSLYQLLIQTNPAGTADFGSALDVLEKLHTLNVNGEWWYLQQRVHCLYGLKRTDEARTAARKLIDLREFWRNGYWAAQSLAYECQQAGDWTMATEAWELSLRLLRRQRNLDVSTIGQFYSNCAQAYAQAGDTQKAIDCFLRGMSLVPRSDQPYKDMLAAALKTVLQGHTLDATVAEYLKQAAAPGGAEKPQLRIAFAEAYKQAGNQKKALEHLRVAADLLPRDLDLRRQVIEGYRALRDNDAALAAYWSWAKLDPQNIDVYRGMGDLYQALGRPADALLAWATMAQVRPREAEGFRAYAQKLMQLNQSDKAAAAYRQAVKYRPTEYDISAELAQVYARLGQNDKTPQLWSDGESACRHAIENLEDDPTPWLNLGRFLEAESRKADARKLYEQIVARRWPRFQNETYTTARERLAKL